MSVLPEMEGGNSLRMRKPTTPVPKTTLSQATAWAWAWAWASAPCPLLTYCSATSRLGMRWCGVF